MKYTPNVTSSGNGPGGGNIFMRGLSSGGSGNQSQSTTAPFPNVALYLDDQSMQFPARNNDVYMVDMERVEVLEGPQGTLFGGGAQAGAIRYITNKPKLDVTEGDVNAGYGTTAGGDPNSLLNATINLPLIADTLAIRATIFSDHRGGYIDNVFGTISPALYHGPASRASNSALVADDTNPVTYNGMRLSALYKINDNWNALIQQNYQNMDAEGYFDEYPHQLERRESWRPYQIVAFEPAYDKDKYESTAWTLNGTFGDLGAFGPLKGVYTGSYLVRHIHQQTDYSNYLRSRRQLVLRLHRCIRQIRLFQHQPSRRPATRRSATGTIPPEHASEPRDPLQHLRRQPHPRLGRRLLGRIHHLRPDEFQLPAAPAMYPANLAISDAGGPDCLSAVGPTPATMRRIRVFVRIPTRRLARTCGAVTGRRRFSPPSTLT